MNFESFMNKNVEVQVNFVDAKDSKKTVTHFFHGVLEENDDDSIRMKDFGNGSNTMINKSCIIRIRTMTPFESNRFIISLNRIEDSINIQRNPQLKSEAEELGNRLKQFQKKM